MKETKNQRLAREITVFCKQHIKAPAMESRGVRSLLHTALTTFLAVTLTKGSIGPDRGGTWGAEK